LSNRSAIRRVAAAVDFSRRTIEGAIAADANLLLVHHGMFWGGLQAVKGTQYERLSLLMQNDIAVYSSHLPLDAHPTVGNNVLLAAALGLSPESGFARFQALDIGVQGSSNISTEALAERARAFAAEHGGQAVTTPIEPGRLTRRWAICTGAGAGVETLREAAAAGIDTLIVGEGPHWTAVDGPDAGIAIIYAGHYATETLGVRALAERVSNRVGVPWSFIAAPTGL
jgi:dinuclear metal center YbgI/SA1388 family protein